MFRPDNANDFWRGYALITIFISHIPENVYFQFTHRNFGLSDSAELFVFLAGLGLQRSISRPALKESPGLLVWYLGRRAFRIYIAHMLIISLAIALLGGASLILENPLITSWNNADAAFHDPVRANVGFALLSYHIGYFDILPLYVALTLAAPIFVAFDLLLPWALLPAALGLYALVLTFGINVHTWPVEGQWYFNPLAWQLTFVLGYIYARGGTCVDFLNRHMTAIRVLALPILVLGAMAEWYGWIPDPTMAPDPKLFFMDDKTFETPIRVLHFLALAALLSSAFPYIARGLPKLARVLCLLGRNSLNVFCVGSLLSFSGQIARYALGGTAFVDTLILGVGVSLMVVTAWLAEWPQSIGKGK